MTQPELSICDDPTQPYRAGTIWDWNWFVPGERRVWHHRSAKPQTVTIVHPMDERYPWATAEEENGCSVYTWVAYFDGLRYHGQMDLPRGSFRHISFCAECEKTFEAKDRFLCDDCQPCMMES